MQTCRKTDHLRLSQNTYCFASVRILAWSIYMYLLRYFLCTSVLLEKRNANSPTDFSSTSNVPKHAQQKLLTMKMLIKYMQVENQITSICFARFCKRMQVIEFAQWTPQSPWARPLPKFKKNGK